MSDLRQAAQQALELLQSAHVATALVWPRHDCVEALKAALAQPEPEPVAWTDRELELIDGMIEVQLRHAAQCDAIANRTMAERQKGWDMERVALLHKIKSNPPRREWQGLTEEEITDCWTVNDPVLPLVGTITRAIEAALKEKNHG